MDEKENVRKVFTGQLQEQLQQDIGRAEKVLQDFKMEVVSEEHEQILQLYKEEKRKIIIDINTDFDKRFLLIEAKETELRAMLATERGYTRRLGILVVCLIVLMLLAGIFFVLLISRKL